MPTRLRRVTAIEESDGAAAVTPNAEMSGRAAVRDD